MASDMPSLVSVARHWGAVWNTNLPERRCWVCGYDAPNDPRGDSLGALTRAHIVAARNGGTCRLANLLICCRSCNYHLDKTVEFSTPQDGIDWVYRCHFVAVELPPYLSRPIAAAFMLPVDNDDPLRQTIRQTIRKLVQALGQHNVT